MINLYLPRFLSPSQARAIRKEFDPRGRLFSIKRAQVSQRAWATGAPNMEINAMLVRINSQITQWGYEEHA